MVSDICMLLVGIFLTIGTAVFVAAEFSFVTLDPAGIEKKAEAGDKQAKRLIGALKHLSLELSSAQVGITFTTILLGYTMQPAITRLLERGLAGWVSQALATGLAIVLALIFVNVFSMVIGELIPKNVAISDPYRTASVVAPLQRVFTVFFKPLILLINNTANFILKRFGITPAEEISGARSASELAALVRHSAKQGALDVSIATLLTRSIGLGKITAVDVMTARGQIDFLERDQTAADVVALASKTGHSRFPVVGDDLDDILGFVNVRRAVTIPYARRADVKVTTQTLIAPAARVPETLQLAPLIMQLRESGNQVAVVVDEYGGTSGLVTLEDAVEEVVGEVADEHDPRSLQYFKRTDGTWQLQGILRPDEVLWKTGLWLPEDGPYETIGGLIMFKLGKIPQVADSVEVEGVRLTVEAMDGRRVEIVKAERIEETEGQEL